MQTYPILNNIAQERVDPRPQYLNTSFITLKFSIRVATELTKLYGDTHTYSLQFLIIYLTNENILRRT